MKSILVTRPSPDGEILCAALEKAGFSVVFQPESLIESLPIQPLSQPSFDWVIFISPNAIRFGADTMKSLQVSHVAVIGETSKKMCQHYGIRVDAVPDDFTSEGLLALPAMQNMDGQSVLIIKGQDGRDVLQTTLKSRGANVNELDVYRRRLLSHTKSVPWDQIDRVIATSLGALQNLRHVQSSNQYAALLTILVSSDRLLNAARDLEIKGTILQAANATAPAIVQFLSALKREGPMDNQMTTDTMTEVHTETPKIGKLPLILAGAALVCAAGSLLIGFEIAREVRQDHAVTDQQLKTLLNSHDDNDQRFQLSQRQNSDNEDNIKRLQAQLVTLGTSVQELTASNQVREIRWRYSEIEYILRLAQLNLHFQHNPKTAIALLQYADDQLKILNSPNVVSLREGLSHVLSNLKGLPTIDTTGILSQLSALNSEVVHLPLMSIVIPKSKKVKTEEESVESPQGFWHKAFSTLQSQLTHFVTIRRLDQPIKPILAEADQTLLTQTLQYLLQQAQWAVTQQNPAVFQKSLQEAETLVRSHYNLTASTTANVLAQLKTLQTQTVKNDLPEISQLVQQAASLRPHTAVHHGGTPA